MLVEAVEVVEAFDEVVEIVEDVEDVLAAGTRHVQALLTREGPHVLGIYVGNPVVAVCVALV